MKECLCLSIFMVAAYTGFAGQSAIIDPNVATVSVAQVPVKIQPAIQEYGNHFENQLLEQKLNSFETRANDLKWTIDRALGVAGGLLTLIIVVVGIITIKNQSDVREIKSDLKEAVKEAEAAAEKARDWEQKAQSICKGIEEQAKDKIDEFDALVSNKFVELDKTTTEHVKQIFEEAEKQRQMTQKWNAASTAVSEKQYELADKLWSELATDISARHFIYNNWGITLDNWARLDGPDADNRWRQACEKFQKAAEIEPNFFLAYSNWGTALCAWAKSSVKDAESKFFQACEKFKKATEIKPDFDEAFCSWGLALSIWASNGGLEAHERYRLACEKFQKATEIKPDKHEVYNNWGIVLYEWAKLGGSDSDERFGLACEKFQKALSIKSDKYQTLSNWGNALTSWGTLTGNIDKFKDACEKYYKSVTMKPDWYEAFNGWGSALSNWAKLDINKAEKLYSEAVSKFQRAVEIKPDFYQAFFNWGNALHEWAKLGEQNADQNFLGACEKYQRALELKPAQYEAYFNLGCTYGDWGKRGGPLAKERFRQSYDYLKKSLAIKSDHYGIYEALSATLLLLARNAEGKEKETLLEEAEEYCIKSEGLSQGSSAYNYACICAIRHDEKKCKQWLKLGEEKGTLDTRKHAMEDKDLESMRDKEWFMEIRWKDDH